MSASVFGIGRLAVWERAAFGWTGLGGHDTGRWDNLGQWQAFPEGYTQNEIRNDVWALVRVHERGQVFGRVPWVIGLRSATGMDTAVGHGLADIQVGGRWDPLLAGERAGIPAVALTGTVTAPTARRAEQATDLLGASTTGRGAWVAGLAVTVERAVMPWFVRLDVGMTVPFGFERVDLGKTQRYGVGMQAGLGAGREVVADSVVVGAQLVYNLEAAYRLDGVEEPSSGTRGLSTSVSASWKISPEWTVMANAASDALSSWLGGQNRTERWAGTLGVRYAITE